MDDKEFDREFKHKLISELHDISLSLRSLSGRDKVNKIPTDEKLKTTYAERYFARSTPTENSR